MTMFTKTIYANNLSNATLEKLNGSRWHPRFNRRWDANNPCSVAKF